MNSGFFFILLVVIAIAVGSFVVTQIQANGRRRMLAAWSLACGLDFRPARDDRFGYRYPHFACLNRGHNRYAENRLLGRIGDHKLCAFDYHYETDSGDNRQRHNFSAVVLTTNLALRPLVIRPGTFLDRVSALLGFEGIEFESAEFNKQFHVTSPDRRWAFDVLSQATMEFLLDSARFTVEFQLCQIIAYRETIFTPAEFGSAIQVIEGLLSRLPKSLLQELQGAGE